jgi:hypothetical protein
MKSKPLPAHGRELLLRRIRGFVPANRTVCIVDDWDMARMFNPWRVIVKPAQDPAALDFGFVAGIGVLIIAASAERVQAIAEAVRGYRAREIAGIADGRIVSL